MEQDSYRWLEEDSLRTRKWVNTQVSKSKKYFSDPALKDKLKKQFEKTIDLDIDHLPAVRGGKYFFKRKKRGEDQASVYFKKGLNGKAKLLVDPKKLSWGTIKDWKVSKDAKYISFEFSKSSNDRQIIKVFDVEKCQFLKDTISSEGYPYFNTWNPDSSGFWYTRGEPGHSAEEEKYFRRIYYHQLGQDVENDEIIFGKDLPKDDKPVMSRSEDGRYKLFNVMDIERNIKVFFVDSAKIGQEPIEITKNIKAFSRARVEGEYIYLFTDHKAPNMKVLRRKILPNGLGKWHLFIPESKFKLEDFALLKDYLFLEYIENVTSRVYLVDLKNGKKINIKLPSLGSISGCSAEYNGHEIFFQFSSLDIPPTIYRFDLKTFKYKSFWRSKVKTPKGLKSKQEWAISKDGTRIPMFVLRIKGKKKASPTLVYAYGGFRNSRLPEFRSSLMPFIADGGTFVLANLRGGGEFGNNWHKAAIKNKQHKRFEDLAAVLKHLVSNGHTVPEKLSVWGGSNGGLLMSVMCQRYPELFKAAVIQVPVTDMLRFHLFHGGRFWINEYGNPDDEKMRRYLLSYSPYHNVKKVEYPSMLFMTSEHDDRVHPMHTYKMFARLLENESRKNPLLLSVQKQAGHSGAGKMRANIGKLVEMYYFLYKELGIEK